MHRWYTTRVTTLGELDDAMKAARASKTGAYIEIIGGKWTCRRSLPSRTADSRKCTAAHHNSHSANQRAAKPAFSKYDRFAWPVKLGTH